MTTIKCRNLLLHKIVIINSDYEFDGDWMQQEPRLLASNHDLSDGFAFWQTTKVKKIHLPGPLMMIFKLKHSTESGL